MNACRIFDMFDLLIIGKWKLIVYTIKPSISIIRVLWALFSFNQYCLVGDLPDLLLLFSS